MDHGDLGVGIEYPWDNEFDPSLVSKSHRLSSASNLSSRGSTPVSEVSFSSPPPEPYRSYSRDEIDVSHVRFTPGNEFSVSPIDTQGPSAQMMPGSLRTGTPPSVPSRSFMSFRKPNASYEPVSLDENTANRLAGTSRGSKRFSMKRKGSLLAARHGSIPEEEIDMSLLGSAAPMAFTQQRTTYGRLEEDDSEDARMVTPVRTGTFDLSSFTGPDVREINRQEASGILTGGLGAGLKPEVTIKSSDLYTDSHETPFSPTTPKTPTRKESRRISFRNPGLRRAPTLRDVGQAEANKRGEIIEVIVEEGPDDPSTPSVDISGLSGGNTAVNIDFDNMTGQRRQGSFVRTKTEIFYPQDNWKPFSMRWPYLTALIILSVALAVAQEYFYRRGPLYTFNAAMELNTWEYFSFKYLPTLVAVSFGILWQITDFEVKRLEAYYQLSKEGGALAAESINVDYITFFNFLRPLKALRYRHYAVAVSSVATLLAVSAVPTLQAASIDLTPDREHREKDASGRKQIVFNPIFSRLLSTVLTLIAIFGSVLLYQLQRRTSGLVADVKGIAGIAAMANRSHILMDFKNMDTATPEMIHKQLKTHRYSLRNSSLAPEDTKPLSQADKDKYDAKIKKYENPHPLMLRLIAGVPFILSMVAFMIFVPIVLFEKRVNIITDKIPWLVTLLAVGIKLAWGTLETDVRMIEPFYILSKRHASPKVLTLDYTSMAFGWMPIQAFLNGHVLVGLVGLGSVLAEVLTVCSASFGNVSGLDFTRKRHSGDVDLENGADAGEETYASFWVSFILALSILMFLCLVASAVYSRRRHSFLPRQPNTIASVLAFIHQSKMLYDFVGTEKMNNDDMVKHLVRIGKAYGLGWFAGRDGEMHCGVDEEELVSGYKHGEDASKASMPWTTNWTDY